MADEKEVHVTHAGLERFRAMIQSNSASSPIKTMFKRWGARYMAFIKRRFDAYSKGGGDWAPLAASTLRQRRKAGKGSIPAINTLAGNSRATAAAFALRQKTASKAGVRAVAILVDTGILKGALSPGNPGYMLEEVEDGVLVGLGPAAHGGDGVSIGDIAGFHQFGNKHLPARVILTDPDDQTRRGMESDAVTAAKELDNG